MKCENFNNDLNCLTMYLLYKNKKDSVNKETLVVQHDNIPWKISYFFQIIRT